ncbi:hypothetical protein KY284_019893 [Solanum tuberosum]|nr:hypothetical protein KY284_019893 [Solanum tuberosum]
MANMIMTNDTRPMGRKSLQISLISSVIDVTDTGCSNHLSGEKSAFSELDETFRTTVKFGDDSRIVVKGKGKTWKQILLVWVNFKRTATRCLSSMGFAGSEILILD